MGCDYMCWLGPQSSPLSPTNTFLSAVHFFPQVHEIIEKAPLLPKDIKFHFIGHLQSNKVGLLMMMLDADEQGKKRAIQTSYHLSFLFCPAYVM